MSRIHSDNKTLSNLPDTILDSVFGELGIRDIHASRQLARELLEPVSSAVKTLQANDGNLPAISWTKFPRADGLRIKMPLTDPTPISNDVALQIVRTLFHAPSRLKRLFIESLKCEEIYTTMIIAAFLTRNIPDAVGATTTTIHSSNNRMALEQLHIDSTIRPLHADVIAEVLAASIHDLQLAIGTDSTSPPGSIPQWSLSKMAATTLRRLFLHFASPIEVDLTPISSCTTLTELWVNGLSTQGRVALRNTACLREMLQLEELGLMGCVTIDEGVATSEQEQEHWQDVLYGMDQMQQLVLPFLRCGASLWKQIAQQMRSIKRINFASLRVGGPEASPLQQLQLHDSLLLEGQWGEQPEGCLASVMPQLELLTFTAAADVSTWAPGITGHQQLQYLTAGENSIVAGDDAGWNQLRFSTCPKMHTVELQQVNGCNMDALMQQLAGCPELHTLEIGQTEEDGQRITMEGLAALAQGPAGQRLRYLYLATPYRFSLDDVVPLVSEPSEIKYALLDVCPDMPWSDDVLRARQQEDVEGVGKAMGEMLEEQLRARGLDVEWEGCSDRWMWGQNLEVKVNGRHSLCCYVQMEWD